MPIFAKSGRIVIAESIALRPLHIAWGTGDGSWITPPAENPDATALLAEVGRRVASEVGYVTPVTDAGLPAEIELPTGRFNRSATPTNHLLVTANFDFADASGSVIREVAVFAGTQVDGALPPGQSYFTPAQVTNPGRLVHIENIEPIFRSPAVRESFEIVITF